GRRAVFACSEPRYRIPLFRSRQQTYLAVSSDPISVQNDLEATELLIAEYLMKDVLVSEDAQPLRLEVVLLVQMQVTGHQRRRAEGGYDKEQAHRTHIGTLT